MTFELALWYARGRVDAMNGLGVLTDLDAEAFASYLLNNHGVYMPHHETVTAAWEAWSQQRQAEIEEQERTT